MQITLINQVTPLKSKKMKSALQAGRLIEKLKNTQEVKHYYVSLWQLAE